ncbi:MAG: hypothetical protein AAF184_24150 [Pseudomonadota bacterium]
MRTHTLGLILSASLTLLASHDAPADTGASTSVIDGIVETGLNRFLGEPIVDWGGELGTFGANFLGEYDPSSDLPLPLTAATPGYALLATNIDREFQEVMFGQPPETLDTSGENLPLREAFLQAGPSVFERAQVSGHADAQPYTLSRSEPNTQISLDDWTAGEGRMRIRCRADGTASMRVRFEHLVPNGVYTLWHFYVGDAGPGVLPAGGVPNVFVPDAQGNGRFVRELSYCPTAADSPTLAYLLAYHVDGAAYGGFPDAPLEHLYGGVVTVEQLIFPVNVAAVLP